jgi:outer membrane lipoprotein-sorting protein
MTKTSGSSISRRQWLQHSAAAAAALLSAGFLPADLRADTKIASRIAEAEQSHPLVPVLKLAAKSLEKMEVVKDYEATVIKKELIGKTLLTSQMNIKLREEPKDVYLKFIDPHAGRQVLYSPNKRNGNMLVRETGIASLVGALEIDPNSDRVKAENRYNITKIGLRNMLTILMDRWLDETKLSGVDVKFYPEAKIGDQSCKVVQITYAEQRPEVRYQSSRLYIDNATDLPIRLQNWEFGKPEPVLVEDYYYSNLKTNVGLTDADFDPKNPKYGF